MPQAKLIDGHALAATIRAKTAKDVAQLRREHSITPGLAVVLVGDNQASQVYVGSKITKTTQAGMHSFQHILDSSVSEHDVVQLVGRLNDDPLINGILVQLPLPSHIDPAEVTSKIRPEKDVDGFHVINVGRLSVGRDGIVPCTPMGCMALLKNHLDNFSGAKALIVGRSNIVGKPLSVLLLRENCTVTIAHSRTKNLAEECRQADILVVAVGQPRLIKGDWIKEGATVIDVGVNRISAEAGRSKLIGDVDFDAALERAGAITPVPGGVGPMTIACLLRNTLQATLTQNNISLSGNS